MLTRADLLFRGLSRSLCGMGVLALTGYLSRTVAKVNLTDQEESSNTSSGR